MKRAAQRAITLYITVMTQCADKMFLLLCNCASSALLAKRYESLLS